MYKNVFLRAIALVGFAVLPFNCLAEGIFIVDKIPSPCSLAKENHLHAYQEYYHCVLRATPSSPATETSDISDCDDELQFLQAAHNMVKEFCPRNTTEDKK